MQIHATGPWYTVAPCSLLALVDDGLPSSVLHYSLCLLGAWRGVALAFALPSQPPSTLAQRWQGEAEGGGISGGGQGAVAGCRSLTQGYGWQQGPPPVCQRHMPTSDMQDTDKSGYNSLAQRITTCQKSVIAVPTSFQMHGNGFDELRSQVRLGLNLRSYPLATARSGIPLPGWWSLETLPEKQPRAKERGQFVLKRAETESVPTGCDLCLADKRVRKAGL